MSLTLPEQLQTIGLSKNEAAVYVACLELGETSIGLIEQKTSLHRQLIYMAAKKLDEEGLVIVSEIRGRKYFRAADPATLERRVEERLDVVRGLIPSLYKIASAPKEHELMRSYHGYEAIRRFYLQSMKTEPAKSEVRVVGVGGQKFSEIWDFNTIAFHRFEEVRTLHGVRLKLLIFAGQDDTEPQGIKGRQNIDVKVIQGEFSAPLDIVVWTEHVSLLLYGDAPHIIDLSSKQFVVGFVAYFDAMWKRTSSSSSVSQ